MDHDRGVGGLDDRRSLYPVADCELLAVVDRRFPDALPLDGSRLAYGSARDALRALFRFHELWPGRKGARTQPAHDDLELRPGKRRAAAVEFFVPFGKPAPQLGLVAGGYPSVGQQHLDFVDLPLVPDVERELEALPARGNTLARHQLRCLLPQQAAVPGDARRRARGGPA